MPRALAVVAGIVWFGSAASATVALAQEPTSGFSLPRPPAAGDPSGDPGDPGADTDFDVDFDSDTGIEIDPEALQRQRQFEFDFHLLHAQRFESEGKVDDAIREFTAALKLQSGDPGALRGRAKLRFKKTRDGKCPRRAIEDLRLLRLYDPAGTWNEERATILDWMALCGERYRRERLDLALALAEDDPAASYRPPDIRYTVASLQTQEAGRAALGRDAQELRDVALHQLERYREECISGNRRPKAGALSLQADLYRDRGDIAEAIAIYKELVATHPGLPEASAAEDVVAELQLEVKLTRLEKEQGGRPSEISEASYQIAARALRSGELVQAEAELRKAIEASPWFPKAHYLLGLVHARSRRFTDAVEELKMAVRMDRYDHEAYIALGLLYKKEFSGAEDAAAIEHLERALVLRPDLNNLHLLLGELYSRSDRDRARQHYELFLKGADADDPDRGRAEVAQQNLSHELRAEEPLFEVQAPRDLRRLDPGLQRMINEAYLRYEDDGDWIQAERILKAALGKYPEEPQVLNELAMVAYADGRPGHARGFWDDSLKINSEQVDVHERLGILLQNEPKQAMIHLERAAALGSNNARFRLASLMWEENDLFNASDVLDRYLAEAGPYDLYWDRAQVLRERMDRLFFRIYLIAGGGLLIVLLIPASMVFRRLRGASLEQLLARAPKSFPEVARILSLIRHEILKHNTAFLIDVGHALEFDEPDAEVRAAIVARRLFGEGDKGRRKAADLRVASSRDQGIYGRFLGYVEELQKVARTHGVTLNLYRKDPIFSPMIRAFEDLRGLADLQAGRSDHHTRKLDLAQRLTNSGHELGRRAFERLSSLIQSLCIVDVTPTMIREVFGLVAAESHFARAQIAEIAVTGEGAPIRVFRTDLEDILTNVLRNSLHSSVLYGPSPAQIGVALHIECDEITGLTTLAIRIQDRSTERLSNEMLRGRYVERGMGITVDLLSRYDGAIAVEPEPGWEKAVVLRFFTVEESP